MLGNLLRTTTGDRHLHPEDGGHLHVRKTTVAEPKLQSLYDLLSLSATPMGTTKDVT
jgi:hypothetical protein